MSVLSADACIMSVTEFKQQVVIFLNYLMYRIKNILQLFVLDVAIQSSIKNKNLSVGIFLTS